MISMTGSRIGLIYYTPDCRETSATIELGGFLSPDHIDKFLEAKSKNSSEIHPYRSLIECALRIPAIVEGQRIGKPSV